MSAQHTPGPWSTLRKDAVAVGPIDIVAGHIIATVGCHEGLLDAFNAVQAANARLIAAAPELLEVLVDLVKRSPFEPTATGIKVSLTFEQIKRQQAALSKARGES